MRKTPNLRAERYRLNGPRGANYGVFEVPYGPPCGKKLILLVQISAGCSWDHVSVSLKHRTPTHEEMEFVRELFFHDNECVMQLSVPRSEHVNVCKNALHLWRPQTDQEIADERAAFAAAGEEWPWGDIPSPGPIPRPPSELV